MLRIYVSYTLVAAIEIVTKEKIIDTKLKKNKLHYLIKWKGYATKVRRQMQIYDFQNSFQKCFSTISYKL